MSYEVETAWVQAYKSNIEIQFQQKGSRLRDTVLVSQQNSEKDAYDRIGPTEAVEATSRHADTPLISTPHDRRWVTMRDYDWADMIDNKDKVRMITDPTSSYVMNAVYAFGRKMDRIIIAAATATAYTDKTGSTAVAFPSTQDVAVDYVESGAPANSNLTIAKLRKMKFLFDSQEATEEGELITLAVTANQIQSLLTTTQVTSQDYNTVKALVKGEINEFMGFSFKRLQLLTKTGNIRYCLAYPRSAIQVGVGMDVVVDVGPRRDKRNSIQAYACMTMGATRTWEEKVVRVACDETVL